MFVYEYIAYSEQLKKDQPLTADTRLGAETQVAELNENSETKWVLLTRINTKAE
jgi:hypothetical protein